MMTAQSRYFMIEYFYTDRDGYPMQHHGSPEPPATCPVGVRPSLADASHRLPSHHLPSHRGYHAEPLDRRSDQAICRFVQ